MSITTSSSSSSSTTTTHETIQTTKNFTSSPEKMPDGLEVVPDDELSFTLTAKEATPKATLTLKHPATGSHAEPIAFKVKTTQPRRYLVRPNQGLIEPGGSEQVQILLVEKDKISLWQSYERLGQSALDSSKDKFLVQSTKVTPEEELRPGDYDRLTAFWTKVMSNTSAHGVFNTKLPVKLIAKDDADGPPAATSTSRSLAAPAVAVAAPAKSIPKPVTSAKDPASLTPEQLRTELTILRGKYDELVSFSVNLTAERDILNNTLEQAKRDLNKYLHKSAANDNRSNVEGGVTGGTKSTKEPNSVFYLTAFCFWLIGCYMHHHGLTRFLSYTPVIKGFFPLPEPPQSVALEPVVTSDEL